MRIQTLALAFVVAAVVAFGLVSPDADAGPSLYQKATQATSCQTVAGTAVTILAADANRIRWSVWTTSGAATVYFREDGTAVANSATSGPLTAGTSYTEDAYTVTTAVSAITGGSNAWVCTKAVRIP